MSPITHALVGWLVAEAGRLPRRERALVTIAGAIPDIDGLGLPIDLLARALGRESDLWGRWHHALAHNLGAALAAAALSAALARERRGLTAALAFASFHLHLLGDLAGSRGPDGYQWPIDYLRPFSGAWIWTWSGQWELNAWPNIALTVLFLVATFLLAWRRGYSPVGLLSPRADAAFVAALRARFGDPGVTRA